jgi:hypothetical protein
MEHRRAVRWADGAPAGPRAAPLPVPVQVTEQSDGKMLVADLALAPLAAGDYVIEVAATRGAAIWTSWYAFRVLR